MYMLHRLRQRASDEKGFTLIELLVVILIIGILAAIALPAFLGQRTKGQDSSAKSDARNAVSQMESCFQEKDQTYTGCDLTDSGLPKGSAVGQVEAAAADGGKGYVVTAHSKSGNTFLITKAGATDVVSRSCTTGGSTKGGCNDTTKTW